MLAAICQIYNILPYGNVTVTVVTVHKYPLKNNCSNCSNCSNYSNCNAVTPLSSFLPKTQTNNSLRPPSTRYTLISTGYAGGPPALHHSPLTFLLPINSDSTPCQLRLNSHSITQNFNISFSSIFNCPNCPTVPRQNFIYNKT